MRGRPSYFDGLAASATRRRGRRHDAIPAQSGGARPVGALLAPDILALLEESPAQIAAETEEIHPADLADVAEAIERSSRCQYSSPRCGPSRAADVLEYLDEELRTEFLEAITARRPPELVTQMTPDERADTLEEISEEHAEEILSEIRPRRGRRRRGSSVRVRTPPAA